MELCVRRFTAMNKVRFFLTWNIRTDLKISSLILPLSNAIPLILTVRDDDTSTLSISPPRRLSQIARRHSEKNTAHQHTPLRRESLEVTEADTRNARHLTTQEARVRVTRARASAHVQKAVRRRRPFASVVRVRN